MNFWYPSKPALLPATSPLLQRLDNDPKWVAERKWNGWRVLAALEGPDVVLRTRLNGILMQPLPKIRAVLRAVLQPGLVIDGELLFQGPHAADPRYFPFDLPIVADLPSPLPLHERRAALVGLLGFQRRGPLLVPFQVRRQKIRFLNRVLGEDAVEGVVLKHEDSLVELSRSNSAINPGWFKVKETA